MRPLKLKPGMMEIPMHAPAVHKPLPTTDAEVHDFDHYVRLEATSRENLYGLPRAIAVTRKRFRAERTNEGTTWGPSAEWEFRVLRELDTDAAEQEA